MAAVCAGAFAATVAGGVAYALGRRSEMPSRDVLVVGGGGREHALAWRLAQSPQLGTGDTVYVAPGNGGTALCSSARCDVSNVAISATDIPALVRFAREKRVRLVVVGPEQPLVEGLADALAAEGIPCFGPSKAAAELEGSKAYCKDFMARHGIPTAEYATFSDSKAAEEHILDARKTADRVVIKTSGLAAGKGVVLPANRAAAAKEAHAFLDGGKFGAAGKTIVVEELLEGVEASVLAFCDGVTAWPLPAAQDHKRIWEFDQGPNTGGMGAFAPSPAVDEAMSEHVRRTVLQPAVDGMRAEGRPFVGVLFAGLMISPAGRAPRSASTAPDGRGVSVLEFNVRLGDPETQVVLPLLHPDVDLLALMADCTRGELHLWLAPGPDGQRRLRFRPGAAATVVAASHGYPAAYAKGRPISIAGSSTHGGSGVAGSSRGASGGVPGVAGTLLFHAGTQLESDSASADPARPFTLRTSGGRVLAVTGIGATIDAALERAYAGMAAVSFQGKAFRRDIGRSYHRPRPHEPLRVGVLGSTNGTDLAAVLGAIDGTLRVRDLPPLDASVEVVISNRSGAGILDKARARGIPALHVPRVRVSPGGPFESREEYGRKLIDALDGHDVDVVLLVGFMQILAGNVCDRYKWRILNVHPSLLPAHAGGMDTDVHAEVLAAGETESGCTVHFAEETVDSGPYLVQRRCPVYPRRDDAAALKERVQALEGEAFVDALRLYQDRRGFLTAVLRKGYASSSAAGVLAGLGAPGIVPPLADPASSAAGAADAAAGGGEEGEDAGAGPDGALTYAGAGVSIDTGNRLIDAIKPLAASTRRPGADAQLGGFGGLFDLARCGYSDPVLVSGTDGVGTKLLVARQAGIHSTVGVDLVAMCVNDIVVQGAEPLFFLDYFATGKLSISDAADVVSGIAEGCRQAGCALVGGETAEMPGLYAKGDYDLAGFSVGAVERSAIIPRMDEVCAGDVILGLASSGVHSNGFSLVRKSAERAGVAMDDPCPFGPAAEEAAAAAAGEGVPSARRVPSLGEVLLTPTRIYVRSLLPLLRSEAARAGAGAIKALAHITGGGLLENLPRVMPRGSVARLDASAWTVPEVFKWVRRAGGGIDPTEMARTFNLGIGMAVVVSPENAAMVADDLRGRGETVFRIGRISAADAAAYAGPHGTAAAEPRVVIEGLAEALDA
ncbi:hypothetical protein FNF31_07900 [Cafeteria roenbergensis]|uniref:Trifunctional purine biosynthetic protein adenosine-3 n=1 Tax=Cafeteria roenbergensis TaxID=33653 RepID=A0A5A8D0B3_CAFRO|nr:hypothetical protein FNF31_07900 [Cafeteria roenbergensis]KAA0158776.1 hypothetical protein FNF28_06109 [Cafeteria roenbergensis]